MTHDDASAGSSIWRGGLILGVLAALCTALVAFTHRYTAPLIEANEQAYLEQILRPVLGGIEYQDELSKSLLVLDLPHDLPATKPPAFTESMPTVNPRPPCLSCRRGKDLRDRSGC